MHFLGLVGDFYRIKGVAEQPPIEPGPGGSLYYWFETFRRVTILDKPYPCKTLIIDVYVSNRESTAISSRYMDCEKVSLDDTILYRCRPLVSNPRFTRHYVELLESEEGVETISVIIEICGYAEPPSYNEVAEMYRALVASLEGRDPLSQPLWVDVVEIMRFKRV